MNLFDYRRKKDLQGRTTEFRRSDADTRPNPSATRATSNQTTVRVRPQTASRRRVHSRTPDKWVYNTPLDNYRRKVQNAKNTQEQEDLDEQQLKWRKLMPDWFTDEVIREARRRHPVHILYIAKPAWLVLPLVILLLVVSLIWVPFLLIAVTPLLLIDLALWAWYINDWANDYLIITDRRFIQIENVTLINRAKIEIPLDKITEVRIETGRSMLEYIFKVGTATIISTGRSQIVFKHVHDPESIRMEWDRLRKAYFMYRNNFRKERMKNYLENRIWGSKLINWTAEEEDRAIDVIENPNFFQRMVPFGPIRDRRTKQLVWYTHPFLLFGRVSGWIFSLLALILFGIFGLPLLYRLNIQLVSLLSSVAFVLGFIAICTTIWYKYEDWHNDRFVIGEEKVFDIEKKPWGFEETVGAIDIRNVQDVQFEKRGFVANLLNYGTVKITTVGGPFIDFERVPKPELVEDEVSRRKEILKYFDEERQDRLYADFFASYRDVLMERPQEVEEDEDGSYSPNNDPQRRI